MTARTLFAMSTLVLLSSLAIAAAPASAVQRSTLCDPEVWVTCPDPGGRPTTCDPAKRTVTMIVQGHRVFSRPLNRHIEVGQRVRLIRLKTYLDSKRAWVGRALWGSKGSGPSQFGGHFFVCWKPTRRAHFLARKAVSGGESTETFYTVRDFSFAGHYLAFFVQTTDGESWDWFRSVDARTGKVLRDSGRYWRQLEPWPCCNPSTTDRSHPEQSALVVTNTGAIAWLQPFVLRATDASGTTTLATADGGSIAGLRVSGSTFYWTQGGTPHSLPWLD